MGVGGRNALESIAGAIAGAMVAMLVAADAAAQAVVPGDIRARLEQVVADNRASTQAAIATAQSLGNPALVPRLADSARQRAAAALAAATVNEIAARPALADAIVAAALQLAPDARPVVTNAVAAAFPVLPGGLGAAPGAPVLGVAAPILVRATPLPQAGFAVGSRLSGADLGAAQGGPGRGSGAARPGAADDGAGGMADADAIAPDGLPEPVSDPLEGFNRAVFAFNDVVDTFTLRPVAALYGYVTPDPAKQAVRRAVANLGSPVIFANDLLQLELVDAGVTVGRFLINSTAGLLGLFDVAALVGLEPHTADFGQTLHSYGVGAGPYFVLPVLGPSTIRDGVGRGVDVLFDPLTYILDTGPSLAVVGGRGIVKREELLPALEELRAGSLDYYAALRSAYYQSRAKELRRGRGGDSSAVDRLFDEAE